MFLKIFVLLYGSSPINTQTAENFIIKKFFPCDGVPNQKVVVNLVPKTFSLPQVVDITFKTPIPLGNQLKLLSRFEKENTLKINGKQWQHLFTIEDELCRFLQIYIGPIAYEVERSVGIPPGVCPIAKGHYHAVNHTLDFAKFKLQTSWKTTTNFETH